MKQSIESEGDITLITFIYGRGVTVMHWLQESNCVDRKKCLTSETELKNPSLLRLQGLQQYHTVKDHSLAQPTEKLYL
jgi:hypothetical protein